MIKSDLPFIFIWSDLRTTLQFVVFSNCHIHKFLNFLRSYAILKVSLYVYCAEINWYFYTDLLYQSLILR